MQECSQVVKLNVQPLRKEKKREDEQTAKGSDWCCNFYVSWPHVHFWYQISSYSLFRLTAKSNLVWMGEMFDTNYIDPPSFYGSLRSACSKHKVVIYSPGARQKRKWHSHVVLRKIRCQTSGIHFFLDFIPSIVFPSFCPLCSVLHSFIYFSFSSLLLAFFFLFSSFSHIFCLLSFFLLIFLPNYCVYLLSFTLSIPSFLSYLLFIYLFTVTPNTRTEMLKIQWPSWTWYS